MGTETGRRDFWQAHIKAWSESGLTQRAYCQELRLARYKRFGASSEKHQHQDDLFNEAEALVDEAEPC